jgi:hypothetical protein
MLTRVPLMDDAGLTCNVDAIRHHRARQSAQVDTHPHRGLHTAMFRQQSANCGMSVGRCPESGYGYERHTAGALGSMCMWWGIHCFVCMATKKTG